MKPGIPTYEDPANPTELELAREKLFLEEMAKASPFSPGWMDDFAVQSGLLSRDRYAVLDKDKNVVVVPTLFRTLNQTENPELRRVKAEDICFGAIHVSTVFLGINHEWFGGEPLWFETMVFSDIDIGYQDRCSTWQQALVMHQKAKRWVYWNLPRIIYRAGFVWFKKMWRS